LRQFPPPALGRALLAPTLHTRAFIIAALPELSECPIARDLALQET
jgi:hypothetical protein